MKDLKNSFVYKEKDPIDSNGDMSLTIGSLIKISNLVTGSNNITLRKNENSHGIYKMHMHKHPIQNTLHQIIDQLNEWEITSVKLYSIHLN